jgi:hypothetical protein
MIPYSAGRRRTRGPPARFLPCGCQDRRAPAALPSQAPAPAPSRRSSRSVLAVPGQPPGRVPAGARRPAMTRCSWRSGQTARTPGNRQAVRPRTGLRCRTGRRCTGRRCTAPGLPPDRTARPWAPAPGRTVPGRPAQVLVRARTGQVPAVRLGTAPAQVPLARIPAGRAATVAPGHKLAARAGVPVRHQASQDRAGRPMAAPLRTGPPRTGRARPDPDRVPRGRSTPGRTGIQAPARPAPPPVATRGPAPHAAVPAGPVPVLGSSVPDTPVPGPDTPVPDTRVAPDTPVLAARRPARTDPGQVRTRTALAAAGRRILARAGRAGAPDAAGPGAADSGGRAEGVAPWGAAWDGQRPASRLGDAARAGRPIRGRTLPACRYAAGIRALAACRAPAGRATALAGCPRGGAVRVPCRSHRLDSRGQQDRRRLPGKRPAGKRPGPRRPRHWPGRACLGQARCPDDSPGTSWKHRAALATPKTSVGRQRLPDRADA